MSFRPGQAKGANVRSASGGGLVSVSVADTLSIDMSGDGTPGNPVTSDLIIDPNPSNQASVTPAGLYVPPGAPSVDPGYSAVIPAGTLATQAAWANARWAVALFASNVAGSATLPTEGGAFTNYLAGDWVDICCYRAGGPVADFTLNWGAGVTLNGIAGPASIVINPAAGTDGQVWQRLTKVGLDNWVLQATIPQSGGGGGAIYEITDFATWVAFLAAAPGVNGQKTGVVLVDTIVNGAAGSYPVDGRCNVLCAYDLAFVNGTGNVQYTSTGDVYFFPSVTRFTAGSFGGTTELTANVAFHVRKLWTSAATWAASAGTLEYQSVGPGSPAFPAFATQNWWDEAQQGDQLVKVTSADTTADYLGSKVVAGAGMSLSTLNPGANEQLQLISSGAGEGFISLFTFNVGNPGSAQSAIGTNQVKAIKCIAQATGMVNQIGFFATSGGAFPVYAAIYADGDTGALLGQASWPATAAGLNWAALSANVNIVAGQAYWLAVKDSNASTNFLTGIVPNPATAIAKDFFSAGAGMPASLTAGSGSTTTIQLAARRV